MLNRYSNKLSVRMYWMCNKSEHNKLLLIYKSNCRSEWLIKCNRLLHNLFGSYKLDLLYFSDLVFILSSIKTIISLWVRFFNSSNFNFVLIFKFKSSYLFSSKIIELDLEVFLNIINLFIYLTMYQILCKKNKINNYPIFLFRNFNQLPVSHLGIA